MTTPRGLDARHVVNEVIRPVLVALGQRIDHGPHVEQLLLGTAAVESSLAYLRQFGNGPAVGLWQMEPATYSDHCRWLGSTAGSDLAAVVYGFASRGSQPGPPPPSELAWNLRFACAMARVHYLRRPGLIPRVMTTGAPDLHGLAHYWKDHYNTRLGAGTVDDFARAWLRLAQPDVPYLWPSNQPRNVEV